MMNANKALEIANAYNKEQEARKTQTAIDFVENVVDPKIAKAAHKGETSIIVDIPQTVDALAAICYLEKNDYQVERYYQTITVVW